MGNIVEKIGLKDRVRPMDDKSKQTWDKCEDLLTVCKLIGVHTVGMQSRLELDMPVNVDMKIIESDLEDITGYVEDLKEELDHESTPVTSD